MSSLPLINMIHVAKAACLIDTKEQCAIAWERVEEVSAHRAHLRSRARVNRRVIFNGDRLKKIQDNTLKIRMAEEEIKKCKQEITDIYLQGEGFFVNI